MISLQWEVQYPVCKNTLFCTSNSTLLQVVGILGKTCPELSDVTLTNCPITNKAIEQLFCDVRFVFYACTFHTKLLSLFWIGTNIFITIYIFYSLLIYSNRSGTEQGLKMRTLGLIDCIGVSPKAIADALSLRPTLHKIDHENSLIVGIL